MNNDKQSYHILHRKVAHLHRLRREVNELKSKARKILAQEQQERVRTTSALPQQKPNTHRIGNYLVQRIKSGASRLCCVCVHLHFQ